MKLDEIDNIWSVDVSTLSNIDRGQLFFERAKWIVSEILSDPSKRLVAIKGSRIRRSYLLRLIGCRPGALAENPHIRELLREADDTIAQRAVMQVPAKTRLRAKVDALEALVEDLRGSLARQESAIGDLKRELQDSRGLPRRASLRMRNIAALNAGERGEKM